MSQNGSLSYYQWIKLVEFIASWDREGKEFIVNSKTPPQQPREPDVPSIPDIRHYTLKGNGKDWISLDHRRAYETQLKRHYEYQAEYPKLLLKWKKDVKEYKRKMATWKPPENLPDFNPVKLPFLTLRLEAKIVSEEHRVRVIEKCNHELQYLQDHEVTLETVEDMPLNHLDINALLKIKELAIAAEIGVEFI